MKSSVFAVAVFAGLASASPVANNNIETLDIQSPADATNTLTINLGNTIAAGLQGSPQNSFFSFGLFGTLTGGGVQITGITWQLTILSVASGITPDTFRIGLSNTDDTDGYILQPEPGSINPVLVSAGSIDLVASGDDFATNADNNLDIELFNTVNNNGSAIDTRLIPPSTLTIHYKPIPAPGSLALLGLSGLVAGRRRR